MEFLGPVRIDLIKKKPKFYMKKVKGMYNFLRFY